MKVVICECGCIMKANTGVGFGRCTMPSYKCPNPGPLPWATGPLSKKRQINCQDNYNHYTGKSSPSCSN